VELMVAVIALAILTAMAVPNFTTWIRNSRVRSVADALQSGVRLAQAEAQRRTRTVVFFLTGSKDCSTAATASASGSYWQIRTVPNALMTDDSGTADSAEAVQCGALADVSSGVNINASADEDTVVAALCFSADGRQTSVTNPASIGVSCTASSIRFDVASDRSGGDNRPLRVTVGLGGNVRMCDPGKASNAPDGCRSPS
jgi:type IV fimbrial biogenesis protein FimT